MARKSKGSDLVMVIRARRKNTFPTAVGASILVLSWRVVLTLFLLPKSVRDLLMRRYIAATY
jgi:hypothetical protein